MRELYDEDPASRVGLESCVGDPRGRSEALTGVHAGRLLSLENSIVQGADAVVGAEGNIAGGVIASRRRALRGRRTRARVRSLHVENREISRSPSPSVGRGGKRCGRSVYDGRPPVSGGRSLAGAGRGASV